MFLKSHFIYVDAYLHYESKQRDVAWLSGLFNTDVQRRNFKYEQLAFLACTIFLFNNYPQGESENTVK